MSHLLPPTDSKWTHIHQETPLWWGPRLQNLGARELRRHPNGCLVSISEGWLLNGRIIGPYFTHRPMSSIVSPGAMKICDVYVMRFFKAVGRCLVSGWLWFAEVVCFWNPGGQLLRNFSDFCRLAVKESQLSMPMQMHWYRLFMVCAATEGSTLEIPVNIDFNTLRTSRASVVEIEHFSWFSFHMYFSAPTISEKFMMDLLDTLNAPKTVSLECYLSGGQWC